MINRDRACTRKSTFRTRGSAKATLRRLLHIRGCRNLYVYRCPYCPGWHIGHEPGSYSR